MNPLLQYNVSLREFNTLKVAAVAANYVEIDSLEALKGLSALPIWNSGPRLILGGGSNVLFTGDFAGLVARVTMLGRSLVREDDLAWYVHARAGENWDEFVRWTIENDWPGLENLVSIPGTVGAAPIQNIGAYGVELKDRFHSLELFSMASGEVETLDAAACDFGYRDSIFKRELRDQCVILGVTFRLQKKWQPAIDYADVRMRLREMKLSAPSARDVAAIVTDIRAIKLPDPSKIGNAGSFFKNPVIGLAQYDELHVRFPLMVSYMQRDGRYKLAAAWLIEECGWKGRTMGRAGVHDQQALVLVNRGGAAGEDFVTLARAIVDSVRARFGITLEPEPVII